MKGQKASKDEQAENSFVIDDKQRSVKGQKASKDEQAENSFVIDDKQRSVKGHRASREFWTSRKESEQDISNGKSASIDPQERRGASKKSSTI